MRAVQNINPHFYTFSFFLVFILFRPTFSNHANNTLSSTDSLTISTNRTIVSPGDDFELGFFKPSSSTSWYIGIWYKKISKRTYVWVANRDKPLSNSIGTFKISDANLVLLNHFNNTVWSTNLTKKYERYSVVAELLANGNFVMRYSNSNNSDPSGFLWQSFDFPTDTLLPEMKLGFDLKTCFNRSLRSWRSPDDPASGDYSYKLETQGLPEFFLRNKDLSLYRTGPWNGIRFSGVTEMVQSDYTVYNFTENKEEITYTFLITNHSIYSRLTISPSGIFHQATWFPEARSWKMLWALPNDKCDMYKICGPYSYCDAKTSICNCIKGFESKNLRAWESKNGSRECVRKTKLNCGGDMFLRLTQMKLPDSTTVIVDYSIGVKECFERCSNDCNCTAFANADIRNGGSGCVLWTGELMDIWNYAEGGQDIYVRLAAADLGLLKKNKLWLIITGLELVMGLFTAHTNVWFI